MTQPESGRGWPGPDGTMNPFDFVLDFVPDESRVTNKPTLPAGKIRIVKFYQLHFRYYDFSVL